MMVRSASARRSSNLKALDSGIASNGDMNRIFPEDVSSMQCAVVQSTTNREWVRLVGRDHDVHWWHTRDTDIPEQTLDREYDPGELLPGEEWIRDLFEPIRLMFYNDPFNPIPIYMPEEPIPATVSVPPPPASLLPF